MLRLAPSTGQLAWQRTGLGVFCHFGLNTFHGVEWSDGTLDPATFDPAELDADQWVRTAAALGAGYFILTAKHHDGFCLWPTATTDYSVASSPWRGGRGDVVAEVAEACRRHGIRLGLYLSPWDRHEPCYPDAAAYDRFYLAQLEELCTHYGELAELWFDGAGSVGRHYDWTAIANLIARHQPQAMIFNMGRPTIRWVGNEDGLAADPVEYVVASTRMDNYTVVTAEFAEALYLPPECDVSLRRGWFWRADDEPKSLEHLLAIWYRSVGLGAGLLLNLPPDDRGLLPAGDVERVQQWRAELDRRFSAPLPTTLTDRGDSVEVDFGRVVELDHLELREHLDGGQQVFTHTIGDDSARPGRTGTITSAGTIGVRRVHAVGSRRVRTLQVRMRDESGRALRATALDEVIGYRTGHDRAPDAPGDYRAPTTAPD